MAGHFSKFIINSGNSGSDSWRLAGRRTYKGLYRQYSVNWKQNWRLIYAQWQRHGWNRPTMPLNKSFIQLAIHSHIIHDKVAGWVAALAYCAGQISHHLWCDQERTNHLISLCGSKTLLASSQIPDWIKNTVDRLQRNLWQGTYIQEMITPSKWKWYSIRSNEEQSWRFQTSSVILSANVHSQCMRLWHGIACQRKLGYVMKLKYSSET